MNLEEARAQMLGQQIRAWEVLDEQILGVLGDTPREQFVPEAYRDLAFADMDVPLDHGQQMMAPKVEGRMLQALTIGPEDRVLEVGTGTGYLTACLAKLSASVLSVDIFSDFVETARQKLSSLNLGNVELEAVDALTLGAAEQFDVIAVTGSVPKLDEFFIRMLRPGGRLFLVAGRAPVMDALLITLHDSGEWTHESLFETVIPPLINAEQPEPFVL